MTTATLLPLNPECAQGKHQNCNEYTWDDSADQAGPCPCVCHQPALPELPYAGTSGASEASREARVWLDQHGITAASQRGVWAAVRAAREVGATVAELRDGPVEHPTLGPVGLGHHGRVSGALAVLHLRGHLAMLAEKRQKCHVYVLPEHVGDRVALVPQPQRPKPPQVEPFRPTDRTVHRDMLTRAGIPFHEEATRHRTPPKGATSLITGDWRYRAHGQPVPKAPHHAGHEGCVSEYVFDAEGALWAVWSWGL